jgi:hypothetical protein
MTSSQGRQWVVGRGRYCIVGDNLVYNQDGKNHKFCGQDYEIRTQS